MNFVKFILPSIMLLVLLFSITAISAEDLNNTDTVEGDVLKDDEVGDWSLATLYLDVKDAGTSLDLVKDYKYDV